MEKVFEGKMEEPYYEIAKEEDIVELMDQAGEVIDGEEEVPMSEEEVKLDWKQAAKKLKKMVEDQSIDTYFIKGKINVLRGRYNDKERTQELFDDIMGL